MLAGCADEQHPAAVPASPSTPSSTVAAPAAPGPLPAPEALTDVLYRLADPGLPVDQKFALIDGSGAEDAAVIDGFAQALRDSGLIPVGFTATEIAWSDRVPGHVSADVTVHSENPSLTGGFTVPMEFQPYQGGWQLSRSTAQMLLTLDDAAPTPTR
ncbi:hypothetical protein LV457_14120 [Mycobacterium sp. MYCO198283]|uniref:hypothetical protein n=1 Tax=Mycobacterium sp. MYCO198283 TaxID=2883505 RepID=UPI001E422FC5|nr:hypothetical protein [Mycobacterium sp. MYCO198283]MCG5433415.1 hypothetical protein [Mycobacterium sp. MYCO198283]